MFKSLVSERSSILDKAARSSASATGGVHLDSEDGQSNVSHLFKKQYQSFMDNSARIITPCHYNIVLHSNDWIQQYYLTLGKIYSA